MSPLLKKKLHSTLDRDVLTRYCIVSGILAALMMVFVYALHGNTLIGGDSTVLRMDLYHQYGPLFSELYDRVVNGYSAVYSWTTGLGSSFTGNLLNYCCSPFALIILLTGHKNMPEAIALMILLKAVFSSTSFTYYINKSTGKNRKESIAFGMLYAFCGYFVAYSWNVMWLDAMAIFPLVMLGIEKIIQKNRPSLYIFTLTYTMITNYYMAYMVCILSVMYFIYYYFGRYSLSDVIPAKKKKEEAPASEFAVFSEEAPAQPVDTTAPEEAESTFGMQSPAQPASPEENAVFEKTENTVEEVSAAAQADAELTKNAGEYEGALERITDTVTAPENPATVVRAAKEKKKKEKTALTNRRFWRTGLTFALCSVLCFMLAAVCLLPVAHCLSTSSATGATAPTEIKYYFNLFDFLANHLPSVNTTIRSSGEDVLPNIYCGMLTVLLIPMYFLNTEIPGRKKIAAAVLIGAFYLGFSINYLNFIWHGFHMPNDLPYRYSFAYSFLLLTLAYQAFIHISNMTKKTVVAVGLVAMLFVILVQELGSKNVTTVTVNESLCFIIIYCIFIGLMLSSKARKDVLVMSLTLITIAELMVADSAKFVMQQSKTNYVSDYDAYQEISEIAEKDEEELFYRTELSRLRTRMDPSWFGYNGVSVFSSMAYEHVAKLMEKMGLFGNNINSFTYNPQTTLFNSIFDLRYIYDNDDMLSEGDNYTFVAENDDFTAYRYSYPLSLGFAAGENTGSAVLVSENPFENQNNLARAMTTVTADLYEKVGATDVTVSNLTSVSPESVNAGNTFYLDKISNGTQGTATVTIDVEEEGNYYVYAGSGRLSSIEITADNFSYSYVSTAIQPLVLDLGRQNPGAVITVRFTVDASYDNATVNFCAAKQNDEIWQQVYGELSASQLKLTGFEETSFTGEIDMPSDGVLFTSVPYDESWVITVDGKKLIYSHDEDAPEKLGDVVLVGDALFGIKLDAGSHTVNFTYKQRGFTEGLRLTVLGILCVALLLVWNFVIRKKNLLPKFRPALLETIDEWKN